MSDEHAQGDCFKRHWRVPPCRVCAPERYAELVPEPEARIKARIEIAGCDGYTNFDIEGTEAEISYLEEIGRISAEVSEYSCEPTITVDRISDDPVEPYDIRRMSIEEIAASIGFEGRSPEDWRRVDG